MKIATWNVNSLAVRVPQVRDWLAANPVDALCLQELKLSDDKFPLEALAAAGYQSAVFGQKTYNGVAILSRNPARNIVKNIVAFSDEQSRVIAATLDTPQGELRLVNGYFVNGQAPGMRVRTGTAHRIKPSDRFVHEVEALCGAGTVVLKP